MSKVVGKMENCISSKTIAKALLIIIFIILFQMLRQGRGDNCYRIIVEFQFPKTTRIELKYCALSLMCNIVVILCSFCFAIKCFTEKHFQLSSYFTMKQIP